MQRNTFRQAALDHTTPKVQTRTDTVGDPWKGHFRTCFEHCDEAHSITSLVFGFAAYAVGGCDDLSCACLGLLCEFSRLLCEFDWRGNLSGSDFWHGCCSCLRVYVVSSCSLVHSSLLCHPCMFWSFRPQIVLKNECLLQFCVASFALDHSPCARMIWIVTTCLILRRCQSPYHRHQK